MAFVLWIAAVLFFGILACLEIGYRVGIVAARRSDGSDYKGVGVIEGAVFGLLGLLLAFNFGSSQARFEERKQMIIRETNAIGTAWLRLDMLPTEDQQQLRPLIRQYTDARLQAFQSLHERQVSDAAFREAESLQPRIWRLAAAASRRDPKPSTDVLVIAAMNEMFDAAAARNISISIHMPIGILLMLLVTACATALIAGYAMSVRGRRSWLHIVLYAVSVASVFYVVIDLEHPREGLIQIQAADREMVKLRDSMR